METYKDLSTNRKAYVLRRRLSAEVLQPTSDCTIYFHSSIGLSSSKHDVVTKADSRDCSLMKYVYLIRSKSHPKQNYIGITSDLQKRLIAHNSGGSVHTSKFKPWELVTSLAFADPERAVAFERYLKTGSGLAFAKKRLW